MKKEKVKREKQNAKLQKKKKIPMPWAQREYLYQKHYKRTNSNKKHDLITSRLFSDKTKQPSSDYLLSH